MEIKWQQQQPQRKTFELRPKTIRNAKRQPKFASIVFGAKLEIKLCQITLANQYCFLLFRPLYVYLSLSVLLSVVQMNNLASQINEINVHELGPKPNGNICTLRWTVDSGLWIQRTIGG